MALSLATMGAIATEYAAADGGDPNLIHACIKDGGQTRIIGPNDVCGLNERPLHWNTTGPAGPAGPQGPAGPAGPPGPSVPLSCSPDSVPSGATCIDRYEASVWETTNATLIALIRAGTVTLTDLTAGGAVQRGLVAGDYGPSCPPLGDHCTNLYAVSVRGVLPARFTSWLQAAAIARNSGKRLPSNAEWQAAALGTPTDPLTCSLTEYQTGQILVGDGTTGSSPNCYSDVGALDMVGNAWEWVADWQWRASAPPVLGYPDSSYTEQLRIGNITDYIAIIRGGAQETSSANFFYQPTLITTGPLDAGHRSVGFRGVR